MKAGKHDETKARAEEAQNRIMSGKLDQTGLVSELSVLFNYVGCMLYWRGYKDAEHHRRAIDPIKRTPDQHKKFNRAVTEMLEQDINMGIAEVCEQLERRQVRAQFDVDWRSEDFGPGGRAWTEKPLPRSIERAIDRIRVALSRKTRASQRRLLLSLPPKKKRPRA